MLKAIYLTILGLLIYATNTLAQAPTGIPQSASVSQKTNVLKWKLISIDMGKIPQGMPAPVTFEFTNTSAKPVTLVSVQPGCGCTKASYTKEPVAPAKGGFVKATFNAEGVGRFSKTVTVIADNSETVYLTLYGEVVPNFDNNSKGK